MRIRHHVNPLGQERTVSSAIDLPSDGEVEVELGCADAQFLFERCELNPQATFVGVEIRGPWVAFVNERAAALGKNNVRAYAANMNVDMEFLFPPGRLNRVYINFPDPWFKRKHHKRRLLSETFVVTLEQKLADRGELFFQSDIFDLTLDAMAILESRPRFHNWVAPWSFARQNPYGARSLREARCEESGKPIWRVGYHFEGG